MTDVLQATPSTRLRRAHGGPTPIGPRRALLYQCVPVAVLLLVWQLVTVVSANIHDVLPPPADIAQRLVQVLGESATWVQIGQTLEGWALSLVVASLIGLALGIMLGSSATAYRMARFVVDFLRSVPPIALLPIGLLTLGAAMQLKVALAAFAALWFLLIQVIHGIWDIEPMMKDVARSYHISPLWRLVAIVIPSVSAYFSTGLRLASIAALGTVVATEFLGGVDGMGLAIYNAQLGGDMSRTYAYGIVIVVLALLLNSSFMAVEHRMLRWHPMHRSAA
jgi:ABC-type nitrate/sulfonate/bicarbonate transport system permease component